MACYSENKSAATTEYSGQRCFNCCYVDYPVFAIDTALQDNYMFDMLFLDSVHLACTMLYWTNCSSLGYLSDQLRKDSIKVNVD